MNFSSIGDHLNVPTEPAPARPLSDDQRKLVQAVKAIDPTELFGHDSELTFVMDRQAKRMVVRIVDKKTGEVLNQFPAEYLLRLAEERRGR